MKIGVETRLRVSALQQKHSLAFQLASPCWFVCLSALRGLSLSPCLQTPPWME